LGVLSEVGHHGNGNYNHTTISLDGIIAHEASSCARGGGGGDISGNFLQ
jgi:hypothetical protein